MGEPALTALFLADNVIIEQGTNKKSVIGIFDQFFSPTFPVSFPPWSIFAGVTNLEGEHSFALNLVSEQDEVIVAMSGSFKIETASQGMDFAPRIPQAIFPRAGQYRLTFHIDGIAIGQRILHLRQLPLSGNPGIQMLGGSPFLPKL